MFLPSSLVMNMVTKGMTDLSNEILLQFARILLQKEKRLFLSFIQNNTMLLLFHYLSFIVHQLQLKVYYNF